MEERVGFVCGCRTGSGGGGGLLLLDGRLAAQGHQHVMLRHTAEVARALDLSTRKKGEEERIKGLQRVRDRPASPLCSTASVSRLAQL